MGTGQPQLDKPALSPPRCVQSLLLAFQFSRVTLAFPVGHPLVTTLRVLRQSIIILTALAVCHLSISALVGAAEPSQFQIYRGIGAEAVRVARVETTIAMVTTGVIIPAPIVSFEARAIIPPIPLLRWLIITPRLILQMLRVNGVDHRIEVANDIVHTLRG